MLSKIKYIAADCGNGRIRDKKEWVQEDNAYPSLLTKEQFSKLADLRKSKNRKDGKAISVSSRNDKLFVNDPDKYFCKSCGHRIISSGDFYTCGKYNSQGRAGCGSPYFACPIKSRDKERIFDSAEKKRLSIVFLRGSEPVNWSKTTLLRKPE